MADSGNKQQIAEDLSVGLTVGKIEIPVPWGHVAGRWWGPQNKQPLIAIHGWQENAGSWDNLLPFLPETTSVLCIDLPGHGLSSRYPPGMTYYLFWDGICLLRRIVKHFKWEKISIMGHSLGGGLGFMYAASFPNDIDKLICIDVASPADVAPINFEMLTGTNIDKILESENTPFEIIPITDYEKVVDIVCDAYLGSVNKKSCKLIMKRGVTPTTAQMNKTGYYIRRDPRVKAAALAMMSIETALNYASNIKCKVLNIRAISGHNQRLDYYKQVIDKLKTTTNIRYEEVQGTHHVHLNTPENIAHFIRDFLKE